MALRLTMASGLLPRTGDEAMRVEESVMAMRDERPSQVSGERLVHALERCGFVVYRRHEVATILERGARAVAVPNLPEVPPQAIQSVRVMSGLTHVELDALLEM
jgi:hypothetical protein